MVLIIIYEMADTILEIVSCVLREVLLFWKVLELIELTLIDV